MAGGRGRRMQRSTGSRTPKPLVRVCGVPLLERNLYMLLRAGVARIVIAVPGHSPDLCQFARTRCVQIGRARGADVEAPPDASLLVVNADNLTDLDLADLAGRHLRSPAALTVATHLHPFRIPFAEVTTQNGHVQTYCEKPTLRVHV